MSIQKTYFMEKINLHVQAKHLLNHEFYRAWTRGMLPLNCLKEYAKDYYHHVKAFPTYLSALHSRAEEAEVRRILLQNLVEEEGGSPNHPDLWRRFVLALGVTEEELDVHTPGAEILHVVEAFRAICQKQGVESGIAALYAYESQIPAICVSKIEGLEKHYGLQEAGWEYFKIHIAADEEHAAQEEKLLVSRVHDKNWGEVEQAVSTVLEALWNFLSGLCERYDIRCAA